MAERGSSGVAAFRPLCSRRKRRRATSTSASWGGNPTAGGLNGSDFEEDTDQIGPRPTNPAATSPLNRFSQRDPPDAALSTPLGAWLVDCPLLGIRGR